MDIARVSSTWWAFRRHCSSLNDVVLSVLQRSVKREGVPERSLSKKRLRKFVYRRKWQVSSCLFWNDNVASVCLRLCLVCLSVHLFVIQAFHLYARRPVCPPLYVFRSCMSLNVTYPLYTCNLTFETAFQSLWCECSMFSFNSYVDLSGRLCVCSFRVSVFNSHIALFASYSPASEAEFQSFLCSWSTWWVF